MENKPYTPQQDTAELMNLYQQEVLQVPGIPDRRTLLLRAKLQLEETLEFVKGAGCKVRMCCDEEGTHLEVVLDPESEPDLVEMADAIGDTLVVTYGAANALGVQVQPLWNEIQRSNLSKAWPHCNACDSELIPDGESKFLHPITPAWADHLDYWGVVRQIHKREDGKVVKSPDYSPADVRGVLVAQGAQLELQKESAD